MTTMPDKKPTQVPEAVAKEIGTHKESDFNDRNRDADAAQERSGSDRKSDD